MLISADVLPISTDYWRKWIKVRTISGLQINDEMVPYEP
ncbi:hypothetical protein [Citrobacter pasteurii]|nr:hypothetical protein SF123566_10037 [Shigella flexneri 1235-66]CEJ67466.1 hypothetical protein [Citrobacter pasteurii]